MKTAQVLSILLLATTRVLAWGDDGHKTVALIAEHFLDPAVKAKVTAMLDADSDSLTPHDLASEATWADKYRDSNNRRDHYAQTQNWHFIDLEIDNPDIKTACFARPASVDVVRPAHDGTAELVSLRWGVIPYWWKKPLKQLPATFNARAESVVDKPMFRDAFTRRRCIIPASGYYEWLKRPDGKQPYFISAADGKALSFAGLWDRWKNPETGQRAIAYRADVSARTRRACPTN